MKLLKEVLKSVYQCVYSDDTKLDDIQIQALQIHDAPTRVERLSRGCTCEDNIFSEYKFASLKSASEE